jgi:hypothetical protein
VKPHPLFSAAVLIAVLGACGDDGAPADPGPTGSGGVSTGGSASGGSASGGSASGGAPPTSSTTGGGGQGPVCEVNEIELMVSSSDGVPDRFHVPVRFEGRDAALLFDTGSSLTFISLGADAPAFVPDVGDLEIGCDTIAVPGRGGLADLGEEAGLPVIGYLGVDYVAGGTTVIDHPGARLVRHPSGTVLAETADWSTLVYEDVQGHMIAPAELDAEPVRLMVDTGAPHIVWLGQEGQPGDQEVTTADAEGNLLTLYYGVVDLEMAGEPVKIAPVLRAPSFPYLEQTIAALGGNIQGLMGLSAFEDRRWAIDGARHHILIEPP